MVQSPSREVSRPTNSQILRILFNQEVRYSIYKKQPIVPVLIGMNPFHILSTSFFTIHFNIIISTKETDDRALLHGASCRLHYALYTRRNCRTALSAVCH